MLYVALFFILGLIVGSFINVSAYRIPRNESIIKPGSHCVSCGHQVRAYDNIPIVSYIILRGKCRDCGTSIGLGYLIVELITGIIWACLYVRFDNPVQLILALIFSSILITISAIDLERKIIPDKIILPAMGISTVLIMPGFFGITSLPIISSQPSYWSFIWFIIGGGSLWFTAVVAELIMKKQAVGGGDIKLVAFMGLYLGGYVFLAMFIGFFLGAIIGILMIITQRTSHKEPIPFGPFLAIGSLIVVLFGTTIWQSYLNLAGLQ